MFKIEQTNTFVQEIKKSRFRAIASPVQDEEAAKSFLRVNGDVSANHNCWAWRLGQNYRFSDDGEPSGTAGKPILQAIDGQSLDGVVVVVTRWFGGMLLGSGGLMRAYGGTAAACLKAAEKTAFVATKLFRVSCVFSDLGLVEARLNSVVDAHIRAKGFTETGAELLVDLPELQAAVIAQLLVDVTSGRTKIREAD